MNYVHSLLDNKYTPHYIKEHLASYGYSKEGVEKIVDRVVKERPLDTVVGLNFMQTFVITFLLFCLFIFLIFITVSTEAPLAVIGLGFFPAVLSIVFCILIVEYSKREFFPWLWVLPVVIPAVFYLVSRSNPYGVYTEIDLGNTALLNILVALIFSVVLKFIHIKDMGVLLPSIYQIHEKIKRTTLQKHNIRQKTESPPIKREPQQIREYIQSVEDKCKAINFVIGRVYKKKHNASAEHRDLIKISPELYNLFSDTNFHDKEDMRKAKIAIQKIKEILERFNMHESSVFGSACKNFTGIIHDRLGNDSVLEVLIRNDKDPVKVYHDSALDFCNRVLVALKNY